MLIGIDASRATTARRTGTEFYSLRLIEALLALDTPHRFRLYFNQPPNAPGFFTKNQVSELRVIPFPRLWTHVRLGLEIATRPPDVLFVPSHVLSLWTRPPAVVTVHDLGYLHFPAAHPPRQRRYLDWSTRHNARTARVVLADSQATRQDLITHYGIQAHKIVVAYPGYDADLAPVTDAETIAAVKWRYGIRGDYFLHIGTLQPRKNLAHLVQAFADLSSSSAPAGPPQRRTACWAGESSRLDADCSPLGASRVGQVQLVLAGKKGWLYAELFEQVRRLGLEERVLFCGYVDENDKAALLSGAIAYVFPSLYEGFGFPALEAQACDTPLICANTSSLPEVVADAALLVDPTDVDGWTRAMARMLTDADLRADLIDRGRRNRTRFSWRLCAKTTLAALKAAAKA